MKKINLKKIELSLSLISFTFLALWLIGALYLVVLPFEGVPLLSFESLQPIYIFLMYMFSLIIPVFGLLVFMKDNRKCSPRWYFAFPFLVAIFLMTLLRDEKYMSMFFETSYILIYDVSGILSSKKGQALISAFFSLASVLFILSVPERKKEIMKISYIVSVITTASVVTFYLAYLFFNTTIDFLYYVNILGGPLLGFSLLRASVHYNTKR